VPIVLKLHSVILLFFYIHFRGDPPPSEEGARRKRESMEKKRRRRVGVVNSYNVYMYIYEKCLWVCVWRAYWAISVFYVVIIVVAAAAAVAVPLAATRETLCHATPSLLYILSWRRRTVRFIDLPPPPPYRMPFPPSPPPPKSSVPPEWGWIGEGIRACIYIYINDITTTLVRKPFVPNKTLVLTLLYIYIYIPFVPRALHFRWTMAGG